MSLLVLCQWTYAEIIASMSARVASDPFRNGELSRMHSVCIASLLFGRARYREDYSGHPFLACIAAGHVLATREFK